MKKSIFYILIPALFVISSSSSWRKKTMETETIKLVYVYDALCGWCYGFGPVVEKLEKEFKGNVEIEILSGGMVMGNRIAPIGNMSDYILQAIPRLERTTGVTFGAPYIALLKEGSYVTSSEKPSIALCVYKSFTSERSVEYGYGIQKAFYLEAKDLNNDTLYADLAVPFGLDRNQFLNRMQDSTYLKHAQEGFKRATNLGVTGYPTLLEKQDDKYVLLTEGYSTYESIEKHLLKRFKKIAGE
jgi:putative protein-disulfide isomerase